MSENSRLKSWGYSLLLMILTGIVAWLIGFIVIWVTRIFLSPNRISEPPPAKNSIFVGIAILWVGFVYVVKIEDLNSLETNDFVKWDVDITGSDVIFKEAPEKGATFEVQFEDEAMKLPAWRTPTYYLLGKVDGKNKKFKLSIDPKKHVDSTTNTWGEHGENTSIIMTKPAFNTEWYMTPRPYTLKSQQNDLLPITIFLSIAGVVAFLHAHLVES